jgi:hypothetical protein
MPNNKRLVSLESLVNEEPASLMARVRSVMPLIDAGLRAGHSLKTIHARLNQEGLRISYRCLSVYRWRIKRRENSRLKFPKSVRNNANKKEATGSESKEGLPDGFDPAANFHKQMKNRTHWEYPSAPPDEEKLF